MKVQVVVILLTALLFFVLGWIDKGRLSTPQYGPFFATEEEFFSSRDWRYESPIYIAKAPVFKSKIHSADEARNEILEMFSEEVSSEPAEILWEWKWLNLLFFTILALLLHQFLLKVPKMLSVKVG